jgi:hypothetical protein
VAWTQAGFDSDPVAWNARDPKVKDRLVTDLPAAWKPEPFKGQTIVRSAGGEGMGTAWGLILLEETPK